MGIEQRRPEELIINGKTHRGITYHVDGKDVELYRVGALAAALEKSSIQIVKWERLHLFPKPMYRLAERSGFGHCSRWYSREQIVNIRKIWKAFPFGRGRMHVKAHFFDNVKKVFYKTNIITITVKETKHAAEERPLL